MTKPAPRAAPAAIVWRRRRRPQAPTKRVTDRGNRASHVARDEVAREPELETEEQTADERTNRRDPAAKRPHDGGGCESKAREDSGPWQTEQLLPQESTRQP
jgi:hypothetical protein